MVYQKYLKDIGTYSRFINPANIRIWNRKQENSQANSN